jgi:hypothetical protein
MGDGGSRRIDAPASRHFLTLLSTSGERRNSGCSSTPYERAALHRRRPFLYESDLSRRRQRGQKPRGALRYSITVTLRRIRIW